MSATHSTPTEILFDLFSAAIADQAVCLIDELGTIRSWNTGAANFFQYPQEQVTGQPLSLLAKDLELEAFLSQSFAQGGCSLETELSRGDGTHFPAYLTLQPIYLDQALQGYALNCKSLAYTKKITYRFDQAEQASNRPGFFQRLIESSYSGVTLFDAELNFIYRSPSAARITGFNDGARTDITFNDIIHPADQSRIRAMLEGLLASPGSSVSCKLRSRHYEGHFIDLEGVFTNWLQEPEIGAVVLNFRDVTQRQRTEDALRQTINELSAYKQALDVGAIVAITDQRGVITYANDNFCEISGYSRIELIGSDHRILNSGHHDSAFISQMWRTIASGKVWEGEFRNRRKDGSHYWVSTTIVPFLNDHGKPYQYLSIRFDRTEAKLAKQDLIERNQQIGNLLESINDGFIGLDHQLCYTYVNNRTCQMVAMEAGDMIGRNIWELFPQAVGSATWHAIQQALQTGQPVTNEDHYPPLGLWQENHIYPSQTGLSIFISDITTRKREEQHKAMLADINELFNQPVALGELMQAVMQLLTTQGSGYCLAETWLVGRDGRELLLSAQTSLSTAMSTFFKDHPEFTRLEPGQGLPGYTWSTGSMQFWDELESHPSFLRGQAAGKAGLQSALGIPLRHQQKLIGVLLIGQTTNQPPDHLDQAMLERLGEHLGTAISRRQLENDLQAIFNTAPDIICLVGTDRHFKKVNPAMSALLGYSEQQLLNMPIDSLVHPDDLAQSIARMDGFESGELEVVYFENRYRSSSGEIIHLAWTAARGNEEGVLFCIARNISGQKALELAANRILAERNTILESIGDAFFSVDREWNIQYWNHVAEQVLQKPKDKVLGKNLWKVFSSAVGSISYRQYHQALATGEPRRFEDHYAVLDKWYDVNVYPSQSGLSIFFKDITERKLAERELNWQAQALESSRQHYADLFQLSPLPKFVFDTQTLDYLEVNQAAVDHYGYSREEFLSMNLRDIRPAAELPLLEKVVGDFKRATYLNRAGTFTHRKKNGELITVEITSSTIDHNGRQARIALAVDVTERTRHLEEIQAQNQRLRDIAWMQSHTIRGPLARIMGLVGLMELDPATSKDTAQILGHIHSSAAELDRVIRSISTRPDQPMPPEPADGE